MDGKDVNGWFVGYVETRGQVYCFAANIQGSDGAAGSRAAEITEDILSDVYKRQPPPACLSERLLTSCNSLAAAAKYPCRHGCLARCPRESAALKALPEAYFQDSFFPPFTAGAMERPAS